MIRHQEVIEHREVAGVAGDEARAVDLRGRRDQGVRDQDAVALPVATAVGAAEAGDFQVDAVNQRAEQQVLDPALLGRARAPAKSSAAVTAETDGSSARADG